MATHSPTNSPPSSSLSLLVQRAIVKNTIIERVIAQGEFYELSLGVWRRERVMVKTYPPKYERMWFSETEIHQVKGLSGLGSIYLASWMLDILYFLSTLNPFIMSLLFLNPFHSIYFTSPPLLSPPPSGTLYCLSTHLSSSILSLYYMLYIIICNQHVS